MTGKEKNGNIWLWALRFYNKTFLFLKWLITQSDPVNCSQHLCFRDEAFAGLDSLEWLKLEDNSLSRLGGEPLFPRGLKGVELHNNPFLCDCNLQDFTSWLQLTAVPRLTEPRCHSPPRLQVPALTALYNWAVCPCVELAVMMCDRRWNDGWFSEIMIAVAAAACFVLMLHHSNISW